MLALVALFNLVSGCVFLETVLNSKVNVGLFCGLSSALLVYILINTPGSRKAHKGKKRFFWRSLYIKQATKKEKADQVIEIE